MDKLCRDLRSRVDSIKEKKNKLGEKYNKGRKRWRLITGLIYIKTRVKYLK